MCCFTNLVLRRTTHVDCRMLWVAVRMLMLAVRTPRWRLQQNLKDCVRRWHLRLRVSRAYTACGRDASWLFRLTAVSLGFCALGLMTNTDLMELLRYVADSPDLLD